MRSWPARIALAILVAASLCRSSQAADSSTPPVEKGQRVFVCGHSFHVFIEKPLAMLAKEAGYAEHEDLGVSFIGGSTPMQHWNRHDANDPKLALKTGTVDVLTLAPFYNVPEEGIDKFSDLAIEKNQGVRVFLQLSWPTFDGHPQGADQPKFENKERDKATAEDLHAPAWSNEKWVQAVRDQASAINKRHSKEFVYVVPVNVAVTRLREKVIAGEVPGIKKQSELFGDPLGHASDSMRHMISYCWFAAIYRKSPVGLKSLVKPNEPNSEKLEKLMQEIAWEAVTNEPMSGVKSGK